MKDQIVAELKDSAELKLWVAENLANAIEAATRAILVSLQAGGKVIFCGNGGSAADSQHLAAELVGKFQMERPAIPAIALTTDTSILTAIGNDYSYDRVFLRQIEALARPNDILVAITTSGRSPNTIEAAKLAKSIGIKTIGLLGRDGGTLGEIVDIPITVKHDMNARIQECHIAIGHVICGLIEKELYGT